MCLVHGLGQHYIEIVVDHRLILSTYFFRPMLKEVKKSLESHIVLDCDKDVILTVLEQAEDVGLMDDYHSFIITSLVN